jgi:predicted  nucleic acid-binding Zn-ribbon protein
MQKTLAATDNGRDAALERELAGLKADFERLREEKVRAEQNLANLKSQIAELEAKAQEEYGTASLADLEKLLADRRAENERLLAEYKHHIAQIRGDLDAVEAEE